VYNIQLHSITGIVNTVVSITAHQDNL